MNNTLKPNLIKLVSALIAIFHMATDTDDYQAGSLLNLISEKELTRILLELAYKSLEAVRSLVYRYNDLLNVIDVRDKTIEALAATQEEKAYQYRSLQEQLYNVMMQNAKSLPDMIPGEDSDFFEQLCERNSRIEAIKIIRYHFNLGLKESKELVEAYIRTTVSTEPL